MTASSLIWAALGLLGLGFLGTLCHLMPWWFAWALLVPAGVLGLVGIGMLVDLARNEVRR